VDLPGETRGMLRRLENWTPVSVGAISMGQEVGVTPLQMITAVSAMANGGLIVRPHVVRELRRGSQITESPDSQQMPRRVIKETTAATMRNMLEGVVLMGTGKLAKLDGYTSAGKTGTAQKYDPNTGRYSTHDLVASFVGFAPINTPALTILVQLDSPVGPHDGGEVAAPVFKRIAQQVLAYLDVPRDVPVAAETLRASRAKAAHEKDDNLTDVSDFESVQTPAAAAAEEPAPAISRRAPAATAPTVEIAEGGGIPAPQLLGKTVRDVTEECLRMGLTPNLVGTGIATEQSPEPGATIRRGSRITVQFSRDTALLSASARGKAK
jgi:cell division protein FtsI (penicillin-binding protein 3)